MIIKIKDNIDLKELEKYGFFKNENGQYIKDRYIDDNELAYIVYITPTHKYLQIKMFEVYRIAESLQDTLYDLIVDGIVEKVE